MTCSTNSNINLVLRTGTKAKTNGTSNSSTKELENITSHHKIQHQLGLAYLAQLVCPPQVVDGLQVGSKLLARKPRGGDYITDMPEV